MHTRVVLVVALGLGVTGCLSNHYVIPKRELVDLAHQDPRTRNQNVRIIQEFSTSAGPPAAPEVSAGAVVVVNPGPVGISTAGRGRRAPGPRRVKRGSTPASKLADSKADSAKAAVILAVLASVGLAATEGARYDGWVGVHPMHPVHLYFPDGGYTWVPLAQLDPETAAFATKAYVRDSEGPWSPRGRAPLNRQGLTYSVFLGGAEFIAADGSDQAGFISHIQFGFFPIQTVGLQLDIGLGWTDHATTGETIFDSRYALELDVIPLQAGRFHAGVFGQGGTTYRLEDGYDGEDKSSLLLGGGGLLQLDLTTRLALTGRAGVSRLYGDWVADIGIGLSIY